MSASAIANQTQFQDAFGNKKLQHRQHPGALKSHPAELKAENFNISSAGLEDPFMLDSSKYLSQATYHNNGSIFNKARQEEEEEDERHVVDNKSVYSTPIGKSQIATAANTPLPSSATKPEENYHHPSTDSTPCKESDDYNKVVQVIYDHITARALPALPLSEPEPLERQGEHEETASPPSPRCGDEEALALEKPSVASTDAEKEVVEQSLPAATTSEAPSSTPGTEGEQHQREQQQEMEEEDGDEGDDTVIVTLKETLTTTTTTT